MPQPQPHESFRCACGNPAQAAAKPISDKRGTVEYRIKVAGVLARRTAAIAFDRAAGKTSAKVH